MRSGAEDSLAAVTCGCAPAGQLPHYTIAAHPGPAARRPLAAGLAGRRLLQGGAGWRPAAAEPARRLCHTGAAAGGSEPGCATPLLALRASLSREPRQPTRPARVRRSHARSVERHRAQTQEPDQGCAALQGRAGWRHCWCTVPPVGSVARQRQAAAAVAALGIAIERLGIMQAL